MIICKQTRQVHFCLFIEQENNSTDISVTDRLRSICCNHSNIKGQCQGHSNSNP